MPSVGQSGFLYPQIENSKTQEGLEVQWLATKQAITQLLTSRGGLLSIAPFNGLRKSR